MSDAQVSVKDGIFDVQLFRPSKRVLDELRGNPGARWDRTEKTWWVQPSAIIAVLDALGVEYTELTPEAKAALPKFVPMSPIYSGVDLASTRSLIQQMGFVLPPFDHQLDAMVAAATHNAFALTMEMGTGKTKVAIDLMRYWPVRLALVLAPKSLLYNWASEVQTHSKTFVPFVLTGTGAQKRKLLTTAMSYSVQGQVVVITNYESLLSLKDELLAIAWDLVVADESTRIKNPKAKQTKVALKLAHKAERRLILTGTPITNSPLDVYSQYKFLDPDILGHKSFSSFKGEYAVMMTKNPNAPRWQRAAVVSYKNLGRLRDRLAPHTFRVLKEDCLDLPEKVYTTVEVHLSPRERRAYDQMRDDQVVELEGQESVAAPIILTQLLRLQQLTAGFLQDEDGSVLKVLGNDVKPAKQAALEDWLSTVPGKVIVWCRFHEEIRQVSAACEALKLAHVTFSGKVNAKDRQWAVDKFQDNDGMQVFIGQLQAGGMGITLTAATFVAYYSNTFSLGDRLQSEDRPHRIGQRNTVTYTDFVVQDSVDELVLEAIKTKQNVADYVTAHPGRLR